MKLLLDQNISRRLVEELANLFPNSNHVYFLGLHKASDKEIWNCARDNGFTIVTQDSDFNERSLIYGYPPKVIWLRTGNTSTENIKRLLLKHSQGILLFEKDKTLGCLQIYSSYLKTESVSSRMKIVRALKARGQATLRRLKLEDTPSISSRELH